ncbi:MAG: ECF transporter S component [Acholeplasma sp.]|jgi:thiamine transporter|nr:ECF transporter S component [Acholeplasma sp.]
MQKDLIRLTESAILVSIAVVFELLSKMVPFLQMPFGGSVSLAMLPVIIVAIRHGMGYGMMAGFVFGIVNYLIDGYAFFWGSFVFDYSLAFVALGLGGLFSKKALSGDVMSFVYAVLLASFARYIMHSLSGVLFFAEYAGDHNVLIYSFILYNGPYMLGSAALCLMAGLTIYKRVLLVNQV